MKSKEKSKQPKKIKHKLLGKTNFKLLINPKADPAALKEAAKNSDFELFKLHVPNHLKEFAPELYDYTRAAILLDSKGLDEESNKKHFSTIQRLLKQRIKNKKGSATHSADKKRIRVKTASGKVVWRNVRAKYNIIKTPIKKPAKKITEQDIMADKKQILEPRPSSTNWRRKIMGIKEIPVDPKKQLGKSLQQIINRITET